MAGHVGLATYQPLPSPTDEPRVEMAARHGRSAGDSTGSKRVGVQPFGGRRLAATSSWSAGVSDFGSRSGAAIHRQTRSDGVIVGGPNALTCSNSIKQHICWPER